MNIAVRPPQQRTNGAAQSAARTVVSKVVVIHPVEMLRRGVISSLSASDWFQTARFADYSNVADAAPDLASTSIGDLVVVCSAGLNAVLASLGNRVGCGVAILLIGMPDATGARLFAENRIDGVLPLDATAAELLSMATLLAAGGRSAPKRPVGSRHSSGVGRLSVRQLEILELMTRGLLNKQIAWELGLTEGTVKSHVSAILEKLGCSRRTQAIAVYLASAGSTSLGSELHTA